MRYGFFPGCSYRTEAGYAESVEAINRTLGIELTELSDWNCCGATAILSLDETNTLALSARLFALAAKQGFDQIITTCNACYTILRKAKTILATNPVDVRLINTQLADEHLQLEHFPPVRHYLEVLYYDIDKEAWPNRLPEHFMNINVAAYYGCQLVRPWGDLDHPERPTILDRFVERIGFKPLPHSAKTLCCGASHLFPY
jgi:heterodisulfide reductase subunit B